MCLVSVFVDIAFCLWGTAMGYIHIIDYTNLIKAYARNANAFHCVEN